MTKKNYLDKHEMYDAIKAYGESCKEAELQNREWPQMPSYLAECFKLMAEGIASKPRFYGYSYRDDMVSFAILKCLTVWYKFDYNRSKEAFSYFTSVIWNSFWEYTNKERRESYIKHKAFLAGAFESFTPDDIEQEYQQDFYDYLEFWSDKIENEESIEAKKKAEAKSKVIEDKKPQPIIEPLGALFE